MAKQVIGIGNAANDGSGDPLRTAGDKINDNFNEFYTKIGDGTNLYSTQFAVMFSSSLLMQCDAIISSGNVLLRATAETGVNGSVNYRVKREVM